MITVTVKLKMNNPKTLYIRTKEILYERKLTRFLVHSLEIRSADFSLHQIRSCCYRPFVITSITHPTTNPLRFETSIPPSSLSYCKFCSALREQMTSF